MNACEHPEKPAVARCVACGKQLCFDCRVLRKGRNFCWDCAPGRPAGFRSPTFSMLLSIVPGLGQIYSGSFLKGLVFLAGSGGLAVAAPHLPMVLILGFWLLGLWDARMSAHKRNYRITNGHSGKSGASEGDWMLVMGTAGLTGLYLGLPVATGIVMEQWTLWTAFSVILVLSALLGRGGKDVKKA